MPIRRLGKFEGETYLCRAIYDLSLEGGLDDELGESEGFGWYGKFSGRIRNRGPFHVIINENSVGFVGCQFYDNEKQLDKAWRELEDEYAEFSQDIEE